MKDEIILCPHGNVMYSDRVINGVRHVHAGIPQCCFDMQCKPAGGEGFIIVDHRGQQMRIYNNSLIGAK